MTNRGITLVELIIVIGIIGILVVALGFSYQGWQGAYKVERDVKTLYTDLMDARGRAVSRGQDFFVRLLTARTYNMFADTNGSTAWDAGDVAQFAAAKTVEYDMLWDNVAIAAPVTISFDRRGMIANQGTILLTTTADADYDCIIVAQTRINLGKWDGANCDAK